MFLTRQEERELIKRVKRKKDRAALELLVISNQGFVVNTAKRFLVPCLEHSLSLEDLVQEGNLGLIEAVGRFDLRRRCRFLSYAGWRVKRNMRRAIKKEDQLVWIPRSQRERISQIRKDGNKLNLSRGALFRLQRALNAFKRPVRINQTPLENDDGGISQEAIFFCAGTDSDEFDEFTEINKQETADLLLAELSERDREVIELRFGLNGCIEPMILEQIGEKLGVTKERVRQIQIRALDIMKKKAEKLGLSYS